MKHLAKGLRKKGYHHLYFDNFSSVDLVHDLLQDNLYCVATTRTDHKRWPPSMKDIKEQNKSLKHGDEISEMVDGTVECIVWKDNRCVPFLNTIAKPGTHTTIFRKEKDVQRQEVSCPLPVKLYNQFMGVLTWLTLAENFIVAAKSQGAGGGVSSTSSLMYLSIINSHVLTRESLQCFKMTMKEYTLELTKEMMSQLNSKKHKGRISSDCPPSGHFCDRHFPVKANKTLVCRVCSSENKHARISFVCKECNPQDPVHLCPSPCFVIYHTR